MVTWGSKGGNAMIQSLVNGHFYTAEHEIPYGSLPTARLTHGRKSRKVLVRDSINKRRRSGSAGAERCLCGVC